MLRAAPAAAVLLLATAFPAWADEPPNQWVIDTAISALDLCTPAKLDTQAAIQAAEAAGWTKFKKTKLDGGPGQLSVRIETPSEKASARVGLAYQSVTGPNETIFNCYVQTTRPVTEALKAELQRRYGGDGAAGWWTKQTPQGREPLTLIEMAKGLDGFGALLDTLPPGSRVIFAEAKGDDDETQVVIATFAKPH